MTTAAAPLASDPRASRATPRAGAASAPRAETQPRFLAPIGAATAEPSGSRAVVIAPAAWRRGGEDGRDAAGYSAQRAAQARDRQGLHLEDWRGAIGAYAAALRTAPGGARAPAPTISLLA